MFGQADEPPFGLRGAAPALGKVQLLIDQLEEKTTELMGKFNIKSNEQSTREGDRGDPLRISDLNQSLVDQLLERLK